MKTLNNTVQQFGTSIFSSMTQLAQENNAINLAQGFPDFEGPSWICELAKKAIFDGHNQYAPSMGIPALRAQISNLYKEQYNLNYDPRTEVLVTNGATEAIFLSLMALVNPGDEIIVFEPFYDSYIAAAQLAGATIKTVTLKAPQFKWDNDELESVFSKKTKIVLLNNPHNPTGRVFSIEELEFLASLCIKNDCYIMSDEVYEFLTFDDHKHIPFASLKINGVSLKERTITLSSAGKTFGLTGWKVGWATSSTKIIDALHKIHQYNTFCVNQPMQHAYATALNEMSNYLKNFKKTYLEKRDLLLTGLENAGFKSTPPQGTYFIMVPISQNTELNDVDYCRFLIEEKGLATIPPSAFYLNSNDGDKYLRFCFAKKNQTLIEACNRLKN